MIFAWLRTWWRRLWRREKTPLLEPMFMRTCRNQHAWLATLANAHDLRCPECGARTLSQSSLPLNKVTVPK